MADVNRPLCCVVLALSSCITQARRAELERSIQQQAVLGARASRSGRHGEAIRRLERVLADIERLGGHRYLDGALHHLGSAHAHAGNHVEARRHVQALVRRRTAALALAQRAGTSTRRARTHLARAWRSMAWLGVRSEQLDRALEANAKALSIINPLDEPLLASALHLQRSMIHQRKGAEGDAVAQAKRALQIARAQLRGGNREITARASRRVLEATLRLARLYRQKLHDHRRAEEAIEAVLRGTAADEDRSPLLLELARLRIAQARYKEARTIAQRALAASRGGAVSNRSAALLEVAAGSFYLGDVRGVLEAVGNGMTLAADDRLRTLQFLNVMGSTLSLIGKRPEAIKALHEALKIARELRARSEVAATLSNIGHAKLLGGDFAAAQQRFDEARRIDAAAKDLAGLAVDLANLGTAEALVGKRTEARAHLQQALQLARRIQHPRARLKALASLGRIALVEGQLAAAADRAKAGQKTADKLALDHWRWRFRLLGARVALRRHRDPQARALLEEAAAIIEGSDRQTLNVPVPPLLQAPRQVFAELVMLLGRLDDREAAGLIGRKMKQLFP